jgi:hypothetical protein
MCGTHLCRHIVCYTLLSTTTKSLNFVYKWKSLPPRWEPISERAVMLGLMPMAGCCWPKLRTIIIFYNQILHLIFFIDYPFKFRLFLQSTSSHYYNCPSSRSTSKYILPTIPPSTKFLEKIARSTQEDSMSSIAMMLLEWMINEFDCDNVAWANNQDAQAQWSPCKQASKQEVRLHESAWTRLISWYWQWLWWTIKNFDCDDDHNKQWKFWSWWC